MTESSQSVTPNQWERAQALASVVTALIALAAAVTAYAEYQSSQVVNRASVALSFLEDFETGGYRDDFLAIEAEILRLGPGVQLESGKTGRALEMRIGQNVILDPYMKARVDRLLYFFEKVAICAKMDVCSAQVIDGYFGDAAASFWQYFRKYIKEERRKKHGFAASLPWS